MIGIVMAMMITQKDVTLSQRELYLLAKKYTSDDVTARIVAAVGMQESGGRATAVGDNGKAFGLYQFHAARWREFSTLRRADASPAQQTEVMVRAVQTYLRKYKALTVEQKLIVVGRSHNIGRCRVLSHTAYTRSLKKWYGKGVK